MVSELLNVPGAVYRPLITYTLTVHQNPTSRSCKETSQNTCRFS